MFIAAGLAMAESHDTTLVWSFPQEPPAWNYWQAAPTSLMAPTLYNVLEPLVEQQGEAPVSPLLAESWEISDDGLQYIFHIRTAKFHDGSDLDAHDVVYSILKNKESPVAVTRGPLVPVASVEALDDRTVRIGLSTPSQRFLTELGSLAGIIVPEGFFENYDPASEMIGTGPYVFGEYKPDVSLTLNRFEDYWGEKPFFVNVTERFIPDETAAINALLAGDIDMIGAVLGEGLDRAKALSDAGQLKMAMPAPLYIKYAFLNPRNEKLRDIRVRQAIAHTINRDELLVVGQSGVGNTICQIVIPYTEPWNNGYCPYAFDLEEAKRLLRDAGEVGMALDYPFGTDGQSPQIKEIISAYLEEAGFRVQSRPLDLANWLERVWRNGEYDIAEVSGVGKVEAFICRGGRPPLGAPDNNVCIDGFDEMVAESDAILDRAEYVSMMKKIVGSFADSAWVIPIFARSTPALAANTLTGFKPFTVYGEVDVRKLHWQD